MFCEKCGYQNEPDSTFCSKCGNQLNAMVTENNADSVTDNNETISEIIAEPNTEVATVINNPKPDLDSYLPPKRTFKESIKTCFKKYATFSGRASESEFWWFWLFHIVLCICTCYISYFVTVIPFVSVSVRRLHDSNRSGWFHLLNILPLINLYLIYLWCQDSYTGKTKYDTNTTNKEK